MSELKTNNFVEPLEQNIGRIILEHTHPLLYGSSGKGGKNLIWKGDIDLLTVIEMKDKEKAFKKIKDVIKKVLKSSSPSGNIVIGEIKFGEKLDVKNQIEKLTKTKASTIKNFSVIEDLFSKNVLGKKIQKPKSINEYYELLDQLREAYVLRWDAKDILQGKADEYINQPNPIFKIDFFCWTGTNHIECSNYIVLGESSSDEEFSKSLKQNIYKTLYSSKNYYKVLKRLYSYFRSTDNKKIIKELENEINNPQLGSLYSIISQLKVIETVIDFANKPNYKKLKCSVDYLKWYTQYLDNQEEINKFIDATKKILGTKNKLLVQKHIEDERNKLMNQLNRETLKIFPMKRILALIKLFKD